MFSVLLMNEEGRGKKVHWKAAVCLPAAISCQNKCAAVMSSINMMDGICGAADLTTRARGARSTGSLQIYSPQREISPSLSHTHPPSQARNETTCWTQTHLCCKYHLWHVWWKVTTWTGLHCSSCSQVYENLDGSNTRIVEQGWKLDYVTGI